MVIAHAKVRTDSTLIEIFWKISKYFWPGLDFWMSLTLVATLVNLAINCSVAHLYAKGFHKNEPNIWKDAQNSRITYGKIGLFFWYFVIFFLNFPKLAIHLTIELYKVSGQKFVTEPVSPSIWDILTDFQLTKTNCVKQSKRLI